MKSLNIDIIFPWEIGLLIFAFGFFLIFLGARQGSKKIDDFDKLPFTKPTTKILFGSFLCLFGVIQLLQLLNKDFT